MTAPNRPELDEIKIINLDPKSGGEFVNWKSATISSDFLTPCDTFRLSAGSEEAGIELCRKLPAGSKVQIQVNGLPQLTGYVDKTEISSGREGTEVTIEGRDVLSSVVDSNVDPRMPIPPSPTIQDLCKLVLNQQFGLGVGYAETNTSRDLAVGRQVGSQKTYASKHKRTTPLKEITPHPNEGAFSYLARILTLHGYWLWASVDGTYVVCTGPDYNQKSAYQIVNKFDISGKGGGLGNNVLSARACIDETSVPGVVLVRGTSSSSGNKQAVEGAAKNFLTSRFKVCYVQDRDATTKEKAECIARTFLARQKRNYFVYEATVRGFSDAATGGVYSVDAVVDVDDQICGVSGKLWIESRTFEKSRQGGTTTRLKCIPLGTLVLDWLPEEQILGIQPYTEAQKDAGSQAPAKTGIYAVTDAQFFIPNS